MKLMRSFAALMPLLVLTGCGLSVGEDGHITRAPDPMITSSYTAHCTVHAAVIPPDTGEETEFTFGGSLKRLGMGFWELETDVPESLSGMKISCSGDVFTADLGELTMDVDMGMLSDNSPAAAVFRGLDGAAAAVEDGVDLRKGEDGWVLDTADGTFVFDDGGRLISMAMSSPRVTAEFEMKDTTE